MMFSIRKFIKQNLPKKLPKFRNLLGLVQIERLLNKKRSFASRTTHNRWRSVKGFTLIELLVAMLISTIIISTLLSFVVSIIDIDRREQAKVESQGDVQAALNYIANDLQEALYIYNADGMSRLTTNTPEIPANPSAVPPTPLIPATTPQIPIHSSTENFTPILAFWKRIYYAPDEIPKGGTRLTGCLEFATDADCDGNTTLADIQPKGSGRYVYAMVVYYLIYDNSNGSNQAWSNAARIGRWEIRDGIPSICQTDPTSSCSDPKPTSRVEMATSSYINYWTPPDPGFKLFNPKGSSKEDIMNSWTKAVSGYGGNSPKDNVLLDFIDDTPYTALQDDGTPNNAPVDIAIIPNAAAVSGVTPNNTSCSDPSIGVGGASTQRVPSAFKTASTNNAENLSSFYVCVNSSEVVARVYLRGNALVRLRPKQPETARRISTQTNTYLSTGNVRAFGRGQLSIK